MGFLHLYIGIILFGVLAMFVSGFIAAHFDQKRHEEYPEEDKQTRLSCHTSESIRREIEIYAEGKSQFGEDWMRYLIKASDSKLLRNDIEVE